MTAWPRRSLLLLCLVLPAVAAHVDAEEGAPAAATKKDPLVIGTYPVTPDGVVDGDTIRTTGAKNSIRILALDTEEVFRNEQDRKDAAADFDAYARAKRGDEPRPVKYGTPAGEAAKAHARALLKDVKQVRLEKDAVEAPTHGSYGRILAHVILLKPDGSEVNFTEAMIRAGHTPYFFKYGGSKRFGERFQRAEKEAREAKRGIWSDEGPRHYPDYPERFAWWKERLAQLEHWKSHGAKQPEHVTLGSEEANKRLLACVGKKVTVFGAMRQVVQTRAKDRHVILLSHVGRNSFGLVVFDDEVLKAIDMKAITGMYVVAEGTISLYKPGRPQMVIEKATQVRVAPLR